MPKTDPLLQDGTADNISASASDEGLTSTPKAVPTSRSAAAEEPVATAVPPETESTPNLKTDSPDTVRASSEKPSEPAKPQMHPPNVLAAYLAPMRHKPVHGIPVASLQLRSYSIRNLEFFADFCMRAAFYLKMPARGPVPLPRRTERWTTLRSNFVHKKSQENFERITYKRLITVMDADKSTVEAWLAYVRKWQFYGVGMKANVWEFEGVDVAKNMDKEFNDEISDQLNEKLSLYGWTKAVGDKASVQNLLRHSHETRNTIGSPMTELPAHRMSRKMRDESLGIGA